MPDWLLRIAAQNIRRVDSGCASSRRGCLQCSPCWVGSTDRSHVPLVALSCLALFRGPWGASRCVSCFLLLSQCHQIHSLSGYLTSDFLWFQQLEGRAFSWPGDLGLRVVSLHTPDGSWDVNHWSGLLMTLAGLLVTSWTEGEPQA